uniref:Uncharacterized protein n=1 Tax=Rhizophora mucronata TaxID=61149 RepID=A0A2P2Q1G6_RHIMU
MKHSTLSFSFFRVTAV